MGDKLIQNNHFLSPINQGNNYGFSVKNDNNQQNQDLTAQQQEQYLTLEDLREKTSHYKNIYQNQNSQNININQNLNRENDSTTDKKFKKNLIYHYNNDSGEKQGNIYQQQNINLNQNDKLSNQNNIYINDEKFDQRDNIQQQNQSQEELRQSKLQQLGFNKQVNKEIENYSNLLKNYTKQFDKKKQDSSAKKSSPGFPEFSNQKSAKNLQANQENFGQQNIQVYQQKIRESELKKSGNHLLTPNQQFSMKNKENNFENSQRSFGLSQPYTQRSQYQLTQQQNKFQESIYSQNQNYSQHQNSANIQTLKTDLKIQQQQEKSMRIQNQQYLQSQGQSIFTDTSNFHHLNNFGSSLKETPNQSQNGLQKPIANLAKTFGNEEDFKKNMEKYLKGNNEKNFKDELDYSKIKYYDSFMPDNMKIMNNPLKLLKYKMSVRDNNTLRGHMNELKFMDNELQTNLFESFKSQYKK
ncbi:hypothetical protein PPERSA_10211 [Pseudocohnilembus persalinus]|uniref:Uncharacterized protein n=1 Tax=Pseudocohnilembus persalinus TaxID=266149 RepID=A0A0V0QLS4_PSEPJ|nr:hypothetical protein PPERSA_10211 [Pseudocohnilembus persalinus]|eukprot:KRX03130.1 hypothetical protein PPERSA_10211 [Pseudocohnilembus persalinus]